MTRREPPSDTEAKVEGNPVDVVGRLAAGARTTLSEQDGGTLIRYAVDAALTGKLGGIGEPVFRVEGARIAKDLRRTCGSEIERGGADGQHEDPFDLVEPGSLAEAVALLGPGGDRRPCARSPAARR